jgi:hypothetical protein
MSNASSSSPSAIDIQALLAEFDHSGLRPAAFARSKGLPPWKIYGALQRRGGKRRSRRAVAGVQSNALLPVRVVVDHAGKPAVPLELLLAGGHRVLLGPDFDVPTLRRLLQALAPC